MMRHAYAYWGLGHMSHPEDPTGCCDMPEGAPIHLCRELVGGGRPRDWTYCGLPYGHDGDHEVKA